LLSFPAPLRSFPFRRHLAYRIFGHRPFTAHSCNLTQCASRLFFFVATSSGFCLTYCVCSLIKYLCPPLTSRFLFSFLPRTPSWAGRNEHWAFRLRFNLHSLNGKGRHIPLPPHVRRPPHLFNFYSTRRTASCSVLFCSAVFDLVPNPFLLRILFFLTSYKFPNFAPFLRAAKLLSPTRCCSFSGSAIYSFLLRQFRLISLSTPSNSFRSQLSCPNVVTNFGLYFYFSNLKTPVVFPHPLTFFVFWICPLPVAFFPVGPPLAALPTEYAGSKL